MRKYSVVNEEGVIETFIQNVGDADHAALDAAMELAARSGEDVFEVFADGSEVMVWQFDEMMEWDGFRSDAEADADALASAGMGTDEDYGGCCDW